MHALQWVFRPSSLLRSLALLAGLLLPTLETAAQPQVWLNTADSLYEASHYTASIARLDSFIATYPYRRYDLGEAYWKRSLNHLALGQMRQAETDNQKSADLRKAISPEDLGKNEWLWAKIRLAENKPLEALQRTRRADAFPYLDAPTMPASIAMTRARALLAMGDLESALAATSAAREIVEIIEGPEAPLLGAIFQLEGQVLMRQGTWAAAAEAFEAALALSDQPEVRLALGTAQMQQGALDEAVRNLKKVQEKGMPEAALSASLKLAELELRARDFSGALAMLETASQFSLPVMQAKGGERSPASPAGLAQPEASLERLRARAWLLQPANEGRLKAWTAAQRGAAALRKAVEEAFGRPDAMQALQPEWAIFDHGLEAFYALQEDPAYEKDITAKAFEWVQQAERTRFEARWQGQRSLPAPLTLDTLQAQLPPSTTRLIFYEGESTLFGLALTAENARFIKLEKGALLNSGHNLLLALRQKDSRSFIVHSRATYQALIKPFEPLLKKQRRLEIYLPDGLVFLPVEALLIKQPRLRRRVRFHRYDYLATAHNLVFLPQPAALPATSGPKAYTHWAGISPDFSSGSAATRLAAEAALEAKMYQYGISTPEGQITPLPNPPSSVLKAAEALPDAIRKKLFSTPMPATAWDTLLQIGPESALMLYLNLPFFYNERLPFQSGWVCGGESGRPWILLAETNQRLAESGLFILPTVPPKYLPLARQATGGPVYFPPSAPENLRNWYQAVGQYPLEAGTRKAVKSLLKDKATAAPWYWAGAKLYP